MAITSITITSVTEIVGTNRIKVNYTVAGTNPATDFVNVFLVFRNALAPYPNAGFFRAFSISGEHLNQGIGNHILYWDRPDLNYGYYEGKVSLILIYILL